MDALSALSEYHDGHTHNDFFSDTFAHPTMTAGSRGPLYRSPQYNSCLVTGRPVNIYIYIYIYIVYDMASSISFPSRCCANVE